MQNEYDFRPNIKSEGGLYGLLLALLVLFYVVCPFDFAPGTFLDEIAAAAIAIAAVWSDWRRGATSEY